jgi:hypothetical protein
MNYEIFSYNNIRHILYISYYGIICYRCNARILNSRTKNEYCTSMAQGHEGQLRLTIVVACFLAVLSPSVQAGHDWMAERVPEPGYPHASRNDPGALEKATNRAPTEDR